HHPHECRGGRARGLRHRLWHAPGPDAVLRLAADRVTAVGAAVVLLLAVTALGTGMLLAALTVAYRDFRHVVPFLVQLWMFATPSVYMNASIFGPRWQAVLPLNPAYGLIDNFRAATLGRPFDYYSLGVSLLVTVALVLIG